MTRARLALAGAVLLALVGSFAAGRYTARPAVERIETHATADTLVTDKLALATAELVTAKRDLATWQARGASSSTNTTTVTRWLPAVPAANGCPAVPAHVEQVTTAATRAEEHAQGGTREAATGQRQASTQGHRETTAEEHQTVVTLHAIEARPDWSATLLAGGQLGGRRLVDALPSPLVVGVAVERRILGPVSVGLWATSGMAAGLAVRLDW